MFQRLLYSMWLGWLDLFRLWSTTQHHIIIVAGICLPVLMLLGIKRGHVETLRRDLVTSPTGRQITFWSAQKGELMNRQSLDQLKDNLKLIEIVIPETQKIVGLSHNVAGSQKTVETVTVFATLENDPMLTQFGLQVPTENSLDVLLGNDLAKRLEAKVGDSVEMKLVRRNNGADENVSLSLNVTGLVPTEENAASIAYLNLNLLDQFEAYSRGFQVPEKNWPSAKNVALDVYSGYLLFCEVGNDLTLDDKKFLHEKGLMFTLVTPESLTPLDTLLNENVSENVKTYFVHTERSVEKIGARLKIAPSELSESTECDDVVLPWNPPSVFEVEGKQATLIGLSLSKRSWLREYFKKPEILFDYEANAFNYLPSGDYLATANYSLKLDNGQVIQLQPSEEKVGEVETSNDQPHAFTDGEIISVPATLLAWLQQFQDGAIDFDSRINMFVPLPQPTIYDRARIYARTIDDVPSVVDELSERGFAVMSETGRIHEIHRQDSSLQLLVWIVGLGVFLFGTVTVFSVLMDSTDRKRGAIGILRVMGMSRSGIFASILMRAALIGAFGAILSLICGLGLAMFLGWSPSPAIAWLNWKPTVAIEISQMDLLLVCVGAMLCCGLGAIPPAWKASRLDPFDAIVEGRFR